MRCAIWYHWPNLKNCEKHSIDECILACTPPWLFLTFLKLCKWYQIAQNITLIMESVTKTCSLEMAVYMFWKFKEKQPLVLAKFLKNVFCGDHFQSSYKRQACNLSKSEFLHGDFFSILSAFTNTYFKEYSSGCFRHKFVYRFVKEAQRNKKQNFH